MIKLKIKSLFILAVIVLFGACKDNDTSMVMLHLHPVVGSEDFAYDQVFEIDGVAMKFSLAQFYVHGLSFHDDEGNMQSIDKYFLVKPTQHMYEAGEINSGHVHELKFNIGVDATANAQTEANFTERADDDPLAQQDPAMHWNWNMGYIFAKIEGEADTDGDGTPDAQFEQHIGMNDMLRVVELTSHKDVEGDDFTFDLKVDYAAFFSGIDLSEAPTKHGMNPELMDNIAAAITLE